MAKVCRPPELYGGAAAPCYRSARYISSSLAGPDRVSDRVTREEAGHGLASSLLTRTRPVRLNSPLTCIRPGFMRPTSNLQASGEKWEGEEPDIIWILEQEALIKPIVVPPGVSPPPPFRCREPHPIHPLTTGDEATLCIARYVPIDAKGVALVFNFSFIDNSLY